MVSASCTSQPSHFTRDRITQTIGIYLAARKKLTKIKSFRQQETARASKRGSDTMETIREEAVPAVPRPRPDVTRLHRLSPSLEDQVVNKAAPRTHIVHEISLDTAPTDEGRTPSPLTAKNHYAMWVKRHDRVLTPACTVYPPRGA